jgi:ribosomal protein L22
MAEEPKEDEVVEETPAAPEKPAAEAPAAAAAEEKPKPRRSRAKKAEPEAAAEESAAEEPVAAAAEPEAPAAAEAKPAAKPRSRARRGAPEPAGPPPLVRAQAKYVRTSARKARLVCDHIRGKSVTEARAILAFAPRAVARDWAKLLDSAVANAEHNHELIGDELRIKEAYADEGPTIKRFRPRAMGRATPILKRTSHLTITLTPEGDR